MSHQWVLSSSRNKNREKEEQMLGDMRYLKYQVYYCTDGVT